MRLTLPGRLGRNTMFELLLAIAIWPLWIVLAGFLAIVAHMIIETIMNKVWGKQPKGQKWSRK